MKEKIIKYGKFILPVIAVIIAVITINTKASTQPEIIEENIEKKEEIIEPQEEKEEPKEIEIKVDIKGEINNPGVYKLKEGDRVSDAINASGGLTENADTTLINLSKNLKDEMVIIIYNKYEIEQIKQENKEPQTIIKYIEKECNCPDTINDACIEPKVSGEPTESEQKNDKISINTGTLEELKTLPGIGESKAKSIIEYREENGSFKNIEEIQNVKGIGTSLFEKFKDYITL